MSLYAQLAAAPCNALVVLVNVAIFAYQWNYRIAPEPCAISYRRCVLERQYYRCITAAFCHGGLAHILMNMYGLWGLGLSAETARGSRWYVETTLLLLGASSGLWLGGLHLAVQKVGLVRLADSSAVGYSGVLFGWMTLLMLSQAQGEGALGLELPGGLVLPIAVMPFVYLVAMKILVPISSFSGHLAGIVAGYLIGWGLLNPLRGFWLWSSLPYVAAAVLLSLRANASLSLPAWVRRIVSASPELLAAADGALPTEVPRMALDAAGVLTAWQPLTHGEIVVSEAAAAGNAAAAAAGNSAAEAAPPDVVVGTLADAPTSSAIGGARAAPAPAAAQPAALPRATSLFSALSLLGARAASGSQSVLQGLLGARHGPASASQEAHNEAPGARRGDASPAGARASAAAALAAPSAAAAATATAATKSSSDAQSEGDEEEDGNERARLI